MTLTVTNLSKRIGDKWVLKDVSIRAEPGRIFGVFGPSGSGKSALLNAIADGKNNSASLSGVAEAKPVLYPGHSGRGPFWKKLFGTGPGPNAAKTAAIEQAIRGARGILLLDEPMCGFDAGQRMAAFDQIRIAAKSKALIVIFASSDYDQILEVCNEAAVLYGGTVLQNGAPQEIYERPANSAVAAAVGRNNIFSARRLTSSKSDLPEFQTIEGEHRLFTERANVGRLGPINQSTALAIRPENIVISFGASFPEDNLLKAAVLEVRPHGPVTFVTLDSNGLVLEAMVPRLVGLSVGDECMIGLPPDRIQVLGSR